MRGDLTRLAAGLVACLWITSAGADAQLVTGAAEPQTPRPAAVRLSDDGTAISIEGPLVAPVAADVAALLESHPGVERLRLFSTGGQLTEALELVDLIETMALDTTADRLCLSACTLAFVAGRERTVESCARIGLHRFGPAPGTDMTAALRFASEWANQHAVEAMVSHGVSSAFAYRAYTIPTDSMWYPGPEEIRDAGLATRIESCAG